MNLEREPVESCSGDELTRTPADARLYNELGVTTSQIHSPAAKYAGRKRKHVSKYQHYDLKRLPLEEKARVPGYAELFERGVQHDHEKAADPFEAFR